MASGLGTVASSGGRDTFPSGKAQTDRVLAYIRIHRPDAWLVGGYVRDRLLGRETRDLDLIVSCNAISLAREVADAFAGSFFVLDEARDVGRTIVYDDANRVLTVDVARMRAPDLLEDLRLRDFTVNAIAVSVGEDFITPTGASLALSRPGQDGATVTGQVRFVDPFAGRDDLARGLVRAVSENAFRDDPLRMLRAVRQAAELGFRIEDGTANLARRDAPLLVAVSAERLRDELMRIVTVPEAWRYVLLLKDLNLLRFVLPEAAALVGVIQSPPHHQDAFDHTLSVMAHLEGLGALVWPAAGYRRPEPAAPPNPRDSAGGQFAVLGESQWLEMAEILTPYMADLRAHLDLALAGGHSRWHCLSWAALAHDWGKPAMRTVDDTGHARFLEHDQWGALLAQARAQALRMSADEVAYISRLVDLHMRPGFLSHDFPAGPSRRAVYRFFRDAAGTGPDCVLLSLADYAAIRAGHTDLEPWDRRLKTAAMLLEVYFRQQRQRVDPVPLLDGRRIMAAFGLKPGPQIGLLLEGLREAQAVGEVETVEQALAWLTERVARPARPSCPWHTGQGGTRARGQGGA